MVGIKEIKMNGDATKCLLRDKYISNNSPTWEKISDLVESCMVPGLSKGYDEYSEPLEEYYKLLAKDIELKLLELNSVLKILIGIINDQQPLNSEFVSSLFLLSEEMKIQGPWHDHCFSKHASAVIDWYQSTCNFCDSEKYSKKYKDKIFQICMRKLHSKLTKEKWKHSPAALQCYRNLLINVLKKGQITSPLPLVFPATLLQMDDYQEENKIHGLKCCISVLRNMEHSDSGYEEVIYETLIHLLKYREKCVVELALECIMILLPLFSTQNCKSEWSKSDDVFEIILGDMHIESDIDRKTMYFHFLTTLIEVSGNSSIRWKRKIVDLHCDTIDIYLNDSSELRNVNECLKCFRVWLSVGWPLWKIAKDCEILTRFYKLLYALSGTACQTQEIKDCITSVEQCILLIFSLCTEDERSKLLNDENVKPEELGERFWNHWISLKSKISDLL